MTTLLNKEEIKNTTTDDILDEIRKIQIQLIKYNR